MSEVIAPRPPSFASLVQQFFTEYLVSQRALSPRTIASYRDALMLFLDFAHKRLGKQPTALLLADIEPDLILAFLDYLEAERHNTVRSRNLRLTALRAFLRFAARRDVSSFYVVERALGVPMKRFDRPILGFMSRDEMLEVMGQPGDTWTSQRDHLLLVMLYNTGARVSEIIGVRVADVVLDGAPCVHLHGKGRKQRSTPLWKSTILEIQNIIEHSMLPAVCTCVMEADQSLTIRVCDCMTGKVELIATNVPIWNLNSPHDIAVLVADIQQKIEAHKSISSTLAS